MKLVQIARRVLEAGTTQGIEAAGIAVCGPLWAVLRPIVIPVVESVVHIPAVPDERLKAAIEEVEARDENARVLARALEPALSDLSEDMFQILRIQAHVNAGVTQINKARRGRLYWQLLAAADIPRAWHLARKKPDAETLRPLRAALSQIGVSSEAIDHVVYHISENSDDQLALLEMSSTIDCSVHPFVGVMSRTGLLLMGSQEALRGVGQEWERVGMGHVVTPYLQAALMVKGDAAEMMPILVNMAEVLAAEG